MCTYFQFCERAWFGEGGRVSILRYRSQHVSSDKHIGILSLLYKVNCNILVILVKGWGFQDRVYIRDYRTLLINEEVVADWIAANGPATFGMKYLRAFFIVHFSFWVWVMSLIHISTVKKLRYERDESSLQLPERYFYPFTRRLWSKLIIINRLTSNGLTVRFPNYSESFPWVTCSDIRWLWYRRRPTLLAREEFMGLTLGTEWIFQTGTGSKCMWYSK